MNTWTYKQGLKNNEEYRLLLPALPLYGKNNPWQKKRFRKYTAKKQRKKTPSCFKSLSLPN
jgi:hypothetical protein